MSAHIIGRNLRPVYKAGLRPEVLPVPHADRPIVCRDCGATFMFTAGEQTFFAARGLQHEPARCSNCRDSRRQGGSATVDAALGEGHVHYGAFASFGGRNPKQMHPATCANCKQMTEVPFMPRGDRSVYCSECFTRVRTAGVVEELRPQAGG